MRSAITIVAGLAALCSPAIAEEYVSSLLYLHFAGPGGKTKTIEYAVGISKTDIGTDRCAESLGSSFDTFVADARKQVTDDNLVLKVVTCAALGKQWVKVVRRVQAPFGASSAEGN